MLTRLRVSGFKNLVDVDVRFGPFTCVAGANGVGKSNLFDAITFLSALSSHTLIDAARSVRTEAGRTSDIRSLFHRVGNEYDSRMFLEAEMIIPQEGTDDLGQVAKASTTLLRYTVELEYRKDDSRPSLGFLQLIQESLDHIRIRDASKVLQFEHRKVWRDSVVRGNRRSPFISTQMSPEGKRVIKLSQDGVSGRPRSILAENSPRTVLSTVNAAESPTALLARREMESWRLLQLEPSSLRESDQFTTSPGLKRDGSHLAATLYYLARTTRKPQDAPTQQLDSWVYEQAASRLAELIDDVREIRVDRDERKELLTLEVRDREGTVHPARSLSDGTLRFLALAVLELDTQASGVICLEEPENGIHPARIPAMLRLLQGIATDTNEPVEPGNPLRQVLVNTHSPAVVNQIPDDALLYAELNETVKEGKRFQGTRFTWLPGTWRASVQPNIQPVARGKLISYLNPILFASEDVLDIERGTRRRVVDREDLQPMLPHFAEIANE